MTTLTATEQAYVAEIVGCGKVEVLIEYLNQITSAQETILRADIVSWMTARDDFDSISGGKLGINSNPADLRQAIRRRVVTALKVQHLVGAYSLGGILIERA